MQRDATEIFEPLAAASDLLVRSEPAFDQAGTAAARGPMDEAVLSSVGSICAQRDLRNQRLARPDDTLGSSAHRHRSDGGTSARTCSTWAPHPR